MKRRTLRDDLRIPLKSLEALFEIVILSLIYYFVWRITHDAGIFPYYDYNGKYVLVGIYALIAIILFDNLDCFKFGELKFLDVGMGQLLAIFGTNIITYFQLCLIANRMVSPVPLIMAFILQLFAAAVLLKLYEAIYHKLYAPRNMILVYGNQDLISTM